jgi:hypothetical protein
VRPETGKLAVMNNLNKNLENRKTDLERRE